MRCGKKRNNYLSKLFKICFVLLILINGAFSVACQSKPKDAASILLPCQQLIDKDDLTGAGKCFEESLLANPKQASEIEEVFSQSFFKKCLEFKERENFQQAIVCFEGLSVLAPDSANINFLLAESYYEYNKAQDYKDFDLLERAEQAINEGLKIKPEDAPAYGLYGQVLEQKGKLREALKKYQKASNLAPKVEIYWMKSALTQEKLGDLSSALISYYQVLDIDPKNTLALYNSAKLYEKTGNKEQAIKNYEKLLEIKSEYDDARERLESLKKPKTQLKQKTKIQGATSDGSHRLPY